MLFQHLQYLRTFSGAIKIISTSLVNSIIEISTQGLTIDTSEFYITNDHTGGVLIIEGGHDGEKINLEILQYGNIGTHNDTWDRQANNEYNRLIFKNGRVRLGDSCKGTQHHKGEYKFKITYHGLTYYVDLLIDTLI